MKRTELMRKLRDIARDQGQELQVTEGGRHTKVRIGERQTTVPRHTEINEHTARGIIKHMGGEQ